MKLSEYFENIIIKSDIIKEMKELINQFNRDSISKEECLNQMRNLIKQSKFKWILDSLNDMQEPILYLQTLKGLL